MIGLITALVIGIPLFYACLLVAVYYSYRVAKQHGPGHGNSINIDLDDGRSIYYREMLVDAACCFWCAFYVSALKSAQRTTTRIEH